MKLRKRNGKEEKDRVRDVAYFDGGERDRHKLVFSQHVLSVCEVIVDSRARSTFGDSFPSIVHASSAGTQVHVLKRQRERVKKSTGNSPVNDQV